MKKLVLLLLVILLSLGVVSASESLSGQSITLLSVSELDDGTLIGGTADLVLELRPGNGNVFIDSSPLTKIDTQVATRVAKEIACDFSSVDCSQFDFFYIIRSRAPIIGGPSAGGATALLTLATLEGIVLPESLAMTGAISSGGIITAVSGVREKIEAAMIRETEIVLIPKFAIVTEDPFEDYFRELNETNNITEVLIREEFDEMNDGTVYEVTNIREALAIVSNYEQPVVGEISIPSYYIDEMSKTAQLLCDRTTSLLGLLEVEDNNTLYNLSVERFQLGQDFFNRSHFYAAASYCYTANLRAQQLVVENLTQEERKISYDELTSSIASSQDAIDNRELETFGDLETYGIVKERLLEAQRYLDQLDEENISTSPLAFATERFFSAQAWSGFFGVDQGVPLQIDQETVRNACRLELDGVTVVLNYLDTFVPEILLEDIRRDQSDAYAYLAEGSYSLCLFKASQSRAQAELFVSSSTLFNESQDGLVQAKLDRSQEIIVRQQNVFPILGYSYHEYADALRETDLNAALLFSEYAVVFSDLSAYFPEEKEVVGIVNLRDGSILGLVMIFLGGMVCGAMLTLLMVSRRSKSTTKKHAGPRKHKKQ